MVSTNELSREPVHRGTFKIIVPDSMAVAGTGKADAPTMRAAIGRGMPGQAAYVFHCDKPAARGLVRRAENCS